MIQQTRAQVGGAFIPIVLIIGVISGTGCASGGPRNTQMLNLAHRAQPATPTPGSWAAIEALPPGSRILITTTTGTRVEGKFKALAPPLLIVTTPDGVSGVLLVDVAKITLLDPDGDGLGNGILIGAGIGLGAAAAILAALGTGEGYLLPSAKAGAPLLLSGAGGAIGALIDRAHKGAQIIYLAESR